MLLVITRPEHVTDRLLQVEAATITELFASGLELLHLRKPKADFMALTALVQMIPVAYRAKLVVHPPLAMGETPLDKPAMHKMMDWMDHNQIHRMHICEWLRQPLYNQTTVMDYISQFKDLIFSTGIHKWASLSELCPTDIGHQQPPGHPSRHPSIYYNYVLVSPVFDSLSKQGYCANPALLHVPAIAHKEKFPKCIAMGGLELENLGQVYKAGYVGGALLGSIWPPLNSGGIAGALWQRRAIDKFKTVKVVWENICKK